MKKATLDNKSALVALSGGPDSVALLHWLAEASKMSGGRVYAAHVNYRLRGQESDADERFCRELCKQLKVRLFIKRLKQDELPKGNLQAGARRIRYAFFHELCRKHKIDTIAIGHNKSDNAETVLMNLSRGAGTFGLGGIRRQEGRIIRPLLAWTRPQIEAYLKKHRLKCRVDSSNLNDQYLRNRVRRRVLPLLEEVLGERTIDAIDRSARVLAEQEEYLRQIGESILNDEVQHTPLGKIVLDLTTLRSYHPLLRRIVLALCFEHLSGSLTDFDFEASERFLNLVESGSGTVDLKRGLSAEATGQRVFIYGRSQPIKSVAVKRGTTTLKPFGLRLTVSKAEISLSSRRSLRSGGNRREFVDAEKVVGKLTVRALRPGDRIRPLGMRGEKKLSDFLIDRKVARPLREEVPLLLAGDKIIWVIGHGLSDDVKISAKTKRMLKLEVEDYRGI